MRIALIALAASAALAAPAFAQGYQDRPDPDQGYQGQTPPDQTDQDDNMQDQGPGDQSGPADQGPGYRGDQGPQDRGYQGGPGYQDRGYQGPGDQSYQAQEPSRVERRLAFTRRHIDHEIQIGGLTDDQAARLRSEFRQIDSLDRRYVAEGMTTDKNADLNSRLDLLDSRVNYFVSMTRDHDEYGNGYGR